MIRAKLFKDERGLGNPLTPAERLKNFINNTSYETLDIVVTSTKTLKPTSKRSSEDVVERFYQENHNYRRNEKRKRERRLRRKLETLDLIFEMEGWD